jgi:hypothetical protein
MNSDTSNTNQSMNGSPLKVIAVIANMPPAQLQHSLYTQQQQQEHQPPPRGNGASNKQVSSIIENIRNDDGYDDDNISNQQDHEWEASADPPTTVASEILLSQFPKQTNDSNTNTNRRRVTLSPHRDVNGPANNKTIPSGFSGGRVGAVAAAAPSAAYVSNNNNNNNTDVGGRTRSGLKESNNNNKINGHHEVAIDATDRTLNGPPLRAAIGWTSNEPGRIFVRDPNRSRQSLKPPAADAVRTDRYRGTENSPPKGFVGACEVGMLIGNKAVPSGPSVGETMTKDEREHALPLPTTTTARTTSDDRSSLWNDDDDAEGDTTHHSRPDYRYQEVVRKRAEREGLKPYDCPDCAAFVDTILQGEGAKVYNRNELMCCSRHRSRHTPPSTPPDFWELSFIDERDRKREREVINK